MSYPPVRTEELLMRVKRASQGEDDPAQVASLVDQVTMFTTLTLQKFLGDQDPEMPESTRETIAEGLKAYLETLTRLRAALAEGGPLDELLEETQARVTAVRTAQTEHQATLAQGPTVFPFLNRLLLPSPRWDNLKAEAPAFLQWVRGELRLRTVTPLEAQVAVKLQDLLEKIPEVDRAQLEEVAYKLAAVLSQPPREESAGPTPIPPVNAVLAALDDRGEGNAFVLQHLTECRNYLRQIVPLSAPAEVLAALDTVLKTVDQLERAVRENLEFEEVLMAAYLLESHANSLAGVFAASQAPPGDIYFVKGLPVLFQSVLDAGTDFLAGRIEADVVLDASEHLERAVGEMQRQIETTKDARAEAVWQAIDILREACESLRALAASGDESSLEYASTLCVQANDILTEVNAAATTR